jgi:uncharacterized protein
MTPIIVHLLDEEGNSVLGIQAEELDEVFDQAVDALPRTIVGIHHFWASA